MSDRKSSCQDAPRRVSRKAATEVERLEIIAWTAGLGAITAEALAYRADISLASARGRLQACVAAGLLSCARPLHASPALYVVTPAGMKAIGCSGLDRCRVSAANARHLIACATVAAGLERCYPRHSVVGERQLRHEERGHGGRLASSVLRRDRYGEPLLHRPDLVLWPHQPSGALPLAVEVELTVKAQRRLEEICRAWARCEQVAGVLYLATAEVRRPLARAIDRAQAAPQVVALPLVCLPGPIGEAIPSWA